ncbi:MAG TPA: hypothetical protein PLH22_01740 [Candidatus Colwellbacteria bacterium]|nr:hypothetical protein [Candidatus Colwellbacteria bacterium]
MNSKKASVILLIAAVAILVFTAYYKWRMAESELPETPTPQQTFGPNGQPTVKGPTAPPY